MGSSIRILLDQSMYFMHIGQFIAGLGAPLAQNGIFYYCHHTFSKQSAPLMMSILTLMNPVGTMIGFLVPFIFIDSNDTKENIKQQFTVYLLAEAMLEIILVLLAMAFTRNTIKKLSSVEITDEEKSVKTETQIRNASVTPIAE